MSLLEKHYWIPIFEPLARERGVVSAAVFGVVWWHCQRADGLCCVSLEVMAEMIGTDRATVLRHIKGLCNDGYLTDSMPDTRNAPHAYADTGKADLMKTHAMHPLARISQKAAKRVFTQSRRSEFNGRHDALALALIERDGYKCAECGAFGGLAIDHVIPLSKGGSDDLDNLQWMCQTHNSKKGDRVVAL